MKTFIDEDFLLKTKMAKTLYHDYVENLPILDYHCHIDPMEIADDRRFDDIAQAWLGGDHYKWRLMRANGVEERLVTGDAPGWEKFRAFAQTMPKALGNPVYHWAHLELCRYFGYEEVLNRDTAEEAWQVCNRQLKTLPVREIIRRSRVEAIVTTDDPADDLKAHSRLREDASCPAKVLPGWRPDKAVNITKAGFREYIGRLSEAAGIAITDFDSLKEALRLRMDAFDAAGCGVSDHGLDYVPYMPGHEKEAQSALAAILKTGELPAPEAAEAYQFELLRFLAKEYARRGWVLQLHYGALRNTNSRMFDRLGPDTGYDSIGKSGDPERIAGFLNSLEREDALPKTILYSLNPNDNAMLDSIIGCFQKDRPGKLQHGAAWWFNDTKTGMEEQLKSLANLSLLGNFVGMLTDSRSFLSYTRHEYFRRILCNVLGTWAENGEVPADEKLLGDMARAISYGNAKEYFKW